MLSALPSIWALRRGDCLVLTAQPGRDVSREEGGSLTGTSIPSLSSVGGNLYFLKVAMAPLKSHCQVLGVQSHQNAN